jgi:hypothetical protein
MGEYDNVDFNALEKMSKTVTKQEKNYSQSQEAKHQLQNILNRVKPEYIHKIYQRNGGTDVKVYNKLKQIQAQGYKDRDAIKLLAGDAPDNQPKQLYQPMVTSPKTSIGRTVQKQDKSITGYQPKYVPNDISNLPPEIQDMYKRDMLMNDIMRNVNIKGTNRGTWQEEPPKVSFSSKFGHSGQGYIGNPDMNIGYTFSYDSKGNPSNMKQLPYVTPPTKVKPFATYDLQQIKDNYIQNQDSQESQVGITPQNVQPSNEFQGTYTAEKSKAEDESVKQKQFLFRKQQLLEQWNKNIKNNAVIKKSIDNLGKDDRFAYPIEIQRGEGNPSIKGTVKVFMEDGMKKAIFEPDMSDFEEK